jgi:hypothetical protein
MTTLNIGEQRQCPQTSLDGWISLSLSLFRFLDPIGLTQVFKGSANQVVTPRITAEEYNTKELSWQFFDCQPPKKELNKQQT